MRHSDTGAIALLAICLSGTLTFVILFVMYPPAVNWHAEHNLAILAYLSYLLKAPIGLDHLHEIQSVWPHFTWRAHTLYGVIAGAGVLSIFYSGTRMAASLIEGRHIRGRRRLVGAAARQAVERIVKDEQRLTPATRDFAIDILPGLKGSLEREVRAEIIVGQIGAGKTQLINQRLREVLRRGDRALIHDFKGDFTSWLPGGFALLNPVDARSLVWDVARDVRTAEEAMNFASAMIEASSDPMWSNAARMLFAGWIVYLQKTKPGRWGWPDMAAVTGADVAELKERTIEYYPQARRMIEREDSVTTTGILINQTAFLSILHTLAKAWPTTVDRSRLISMREWLLNDDHPVRIVVFQNAPHLSQMANAWISSILRYCADVCRSPLVGETEIREPNHRRLWFILDEFAMLGGEQTKASGRMNMIADLNALSRSKGIRIVVGCQDWSQVVAAIGKEKADSWQSMVGTLWIMRNSGPAAIQLANVIGDAEIERTRQNVNVNSRGVGTSDSVLIDKRPVFLPSELQGLLGIYSRPKRWSAWLPAWSRDLFRIKGVPMLRAIPVGFGEIAPVLEWPVVPTRAVRPALIPADWIDVKLDDDK